MRIADHRRERKARPPVSEGARTRRRRVDDDDKPAKFKAPVAYARRDPTKIPPRAWLYGTTYLSGAATGTVAPGGTGKTSVSVVEAVAMATGRELLPPDKPIRKLRVVLANFEESRDEIARKVEAVCKHYGIAEEELGDRLIVMAKEDCDFILAADDAHGVTIATPEFEAMESTITGRKIDVVSIDPFVSAHALPENVNEKIDRLVKRIGRLASDAECAIHLWHHSRKPGIGQTETTATDARGGSAWVDGLRYVRTINRMSDNMAKSLGVDPSRYIKFDDAKPNYAPRNPAEIWKHLTSVSLGNATELHPNGDSIGVPIPSGTPGDRRRANHTRPAPGL